jgi:hypothetical protein
VSSATSSDVVQNPLDMEELLDHILSFAAGESLWAAAAVSPMPCLLRVAAVEE